MRSASSIAGLFLTVQVLFTLPSASAQADKNPLAKSAPKLNYREILGIYQNEPPGMSAHVSVS
jgi:hypothetical protein